MKSIAAIIGAGVLYIITVLLLVLPIRLFAEARYLQTKAMLPTLHPNDHVLVEKVTTFLRRPCSRGEIIVFYPPPIEMGGKDLSWDLPAILGRASGLPFFPFEPSFVKRVIGLPGDRIRIESGKGVFINERLLEETSYVKEPAAYDMKVIGDITPKLGNTVSAKPFKGEYLNQPILIPNNCVFVLGDNRNNSEDSHIFGFVDQERIIGRVQLRFYPTFEIVRPPLYAPSAL